MTLTERLQNVAIVGAGGKMGRGISLVLLQLLTKINMENSESTPNLILIDNSLHSLKTLRTYLKKHILRFAEKNITHLREYYSDDRSLIDNAEIIDQFTIDAMCLVHTSTSIDACNNCDVVFEAIFERLDIKEDLYRQLKGICPKNTYFLSNTSSIPIAELNLVCGLNNRIIGFHFYNPPAVQKLVELISLDSTPHELKNFATELIATLKKIQVDSNDIAGFIGNGHFIREGVNCINLLNAFPEGRSVASFYINSLIKDVLLRPMGIFQLIDYVGLDVFKMICTTMGDYINEDFQCPCIDQMLANNVRGGQHGDGSQINGFFEYRQGKISGVYDLKLNGYQEVCEIKKSPLLSFLKEDKKLNRKSLNRSQDKEAILTNYFNKLHQSSSQFENQAKTLLEKYINIGDSLVENQVTDDLANVDSVLMNGFYHLYGPGSSCLDIFRKRGNS